MKIKVASLNPQKIAAVNETAVDYMMLMDAIIEGVSVPSGVGDQPKSLEETVLGAINRAKAAFVDCDYSFGIEAGFVKVPFTKTGEMNQCVCAIYDGKEVHLGLSSAFEPPIPIKALTDKGMTMSEAAKEFGLTENPSIGSSEGIIGILTHGRYTRLSECKQAVAMALIHLENAHLFKE